MTQAAPASSQVVSSKATFTTSARERTAMCFSERAVMIIIRSSVCSCALRRAAHLVAEEFGAGPEHVGEEAFQQALKALPVRGRDTVPRLGSPAVHVVHACQIHVLSVPAHEEQWAQCLS